MGRRAGEGCHCPLSRLVGLQDHGHEREERRDKGTRFLDAHRDGRLSLRDEGRHVHTRVCKYVKSVNTYRILMTVVHYQVIYSS